MTEKKTKIRQESPLVAVYVDQSSKTFDVVGRDSGGKKILRRKGKKLKI